MREAMSVVATALVALSVVLGFGYSMGKHAGYDRALKDMPPAVKITDQQCIAWLFESNMKDVKKKVCK